MTQGGVRGFLVGAVLLTGAGPVFAQDGALVEDLNAVWTLVAACLVFFMQAGFAMVEAGFTRAKNAVNIVMKNLMDFSVGSIVFFLIGFGLMFGVNPSGWIGTDHFMMGEVKGESWNYTFLIFQTVFAATAATIVSGALAERTRFCAYLVYSAVISLAIYPIFGSWAWNSLLLGGEVTQGWLEARGFCDFAGSTVVHSVGGWLALAGAFVIGPRLGKYGPDGAARAILGHNVPMAALGVFILWFGWFGFNAGSTTIGDLSIGRIAVTTNLAAAAGSTAAMMTAWLAFKKPDASMTMNGALAGLVGITAGCATVTPVGALLIGAIAGVVVVLSVVFFDRVARIDDPVGAISVHGVCGAWGTLACGLFNAEAELGTGTASSGLLYGGGTDQLLVQATGVGVCFLFAGGTGLLMFTLIKRTLGLRVTEREEIRGLDIDEHGMEAYAGFQIFTTQ